MQEAKCNNMFQNSKEINPQDGTKVAYTTKDKELKCHQTNRFTANLSATHLVTTRKMQKNNQTMKMLVSLWQL
jgi:hypothetical protein